MTNIAILQREIRRLKYQAAGLAFEQMLRQSSLNPSTKYDPDQPRFPGGNPDGGQWVATNIGASDSVEDYISRQNEEASYSAEISSARRISPALEARCEQQRIKDEFQCRMVGLRACWVQAALRYANCLRDLPIPPLNY